MRATLATSGRARSGLRCDCAVCVLRLEGVDYLRDSLRRGEAVDIDPARVVVSKINGNELADCLIRRRDRLLLRDRHKVRERMP